MVVDIQASRVFQDNYNANSRFVVNVGGTRSTKTYSILQMLIIKALQESITISIVRKSLPSIKLSVLRDFIEILETMNLYDEKNHNKSENTFTLGNSMIEFFSIDDAQKRRGSKRDILYINEANELSYEDFFQLQIRTTKQIYLDFNPSEHFWAVDQVMSRQDSTTIHSTFMDNPFLSEDQINEIKRLRDTDLDYWNVYGLGQFGAGKKLVYQHHIIDEIPLQAKKISVGLDWGFSNDPTAIIEVYKLDDNLYIQELCYNKSMTNQDIIKQLDIWGIDKYTEIIADSAEPKSIEELKRSGFNIKPASKGPDSIIAGINLLKQHKLHVTKSSVNIIKEFQNYKWIVDKDGNTLNKPVDLFNHSMDAIRYVALNKLTTKSKSSIYIGGSKNTF
jgi:phage terminase large subunit